MNANVLQRSTLVLNRNWQPVNIATVARALTMVWNESARFVDPDNYQLYEWSDWTQIQPPQGQPYIQAISQRLRVPEIVALNRFDRLPTSAVTFSRRNLFKRDRFTCQYCGRQPTAEELSIDHVVPRCMGGESTWENCVLACLDCNRRKADQTPDEAGMRLRKTPSRPNWNPVYAQHGGQVESWSKFISEAYWNVNLS